MSRLIAKCLRRKAPRFTRHFSRRKPALRSDPNQKCGHSIHGKACADCWRIVGACAGEPGCCKFLWCQLTAAR